MKVGDLVTKRQRGTLEDEHKVLFGLVVKTDELGIKVIWNQGYGTFWTLKKTVSIAE